MATTEVFADPQAMATVAETIDKCHTSLLDCVERATTQVNSMKNVWTGQGADDYYASFNRLHAKCEESLAVILNIYSAIYQAAGVFEKTAKAVQQKDANRPKLPNNTML